MRHLLLGCSLISLLGIACQSPASTDAEHIASTGAHYTDSMPVPAHAALFDTPPPPPQPPTAAALDSLFALHDTTWVDVAWLHPSFAFDIRYATTNNFMELQVYDCPRCLSRLKTAKALLQVQQELAPQGLGLLFYDCYRPQSAQLKLWQKMPDRRYVAPPSRGSIHSRGGALDLTLMRLADGQALEMGTPYDFFGREAWWSYQDLPDSVLQNRQQLRHIMEKHGFKTVTTEWWHYNYRRAWYNLSDHRWECE